MKMRVIPAVLITALAVLTGGPAPVVGQSCNPQIGLVIDDSGSMAPEISQVRSGLSDFLSVPTLPPIDWTLVAFGDPSVDLIGTTSDPSEILAWVNVLRPSGGGDCPEQAIQALTSAANVLEGGSRDLILITDASPKGGDIDGAIALFQSKGIRVHTILTGDCNDGPNSGRTVFARISNETGGTFQVVFQFELRQTLTDLLNGLQINGSDEDGDSVCNDIDVCARTSIPESGVPSRRLGTNRFALADDDGIFDTNSPPGVGPKVGFTIEQTGGCSCEQIIGALDLGKGHGRYGCSISAMENWTELVNP